MKGFWPAIFSAFGITNQKICWGIQNKDKTKENSKYFDNYLISPIKTLFYDTRHLNEFVFCIKLDD